MRNFIARLKTIEPTVRRSVLIILLYLIPSSQAMLPIDDPDIWWRLRTGQWIIENRAVPTYDLFSMDTARKPWIEYSWSFDALVYVLHARFGLSGLVYFVVAMALTIALSIHLLIRRAHLPFPLEIGLVGLGLAATKSVMTPRPWLFTILFFSLELSVIAHIRYSDNKRLLWTLPLLFFVWANVHIQFVYGLALLLLLVIEALLSLHGPRATNKNKTLYSSPTQLILVTLISIAATMVTPYHYLLYQQIFQYVGRTGVFQNIAELQPMFFRSPDNWITLILTLAAAFVLGWQRIWLPFPTFLLLMAAFTAFRARRDSWFLVFIAVWIISDRLCSLRHERYFQLSGRQITITAAAVGLALYWISISRQISEERLRNVVETKYPVQAVKYVKSRQLPGPLFNNYDWGGFLIWSLPEVPVMIDGRLNLYGDEMLQRSLTTWGGHSGWNSNPDLLKANLIIAEKDRPLASLLRLHPDYKFVYEDNISAVIVRAHRN